MGTSSVTLTVSTKISLILYYIYTYETFVVASANWQIGNDQKYQSECRCPQSSKVKRKGPKSTKSQAKCQKTTAPPPPPLGLPIHVESSPSSPDIQTHQALSPPQPQVVPQPEETSADVHEQTTDPVGSIKASVVSSIQIGTASPQGKVLSMKSLPMDLSFQLIIIPLNFSADIVPSAAPADQPVVPSVSTSQRREIAPKRVSYLIFVLYFTNIWSSNSLSPFSFSGTRLSRRSVLLRHQNF